MTSIKDNLRSMHRRVAEAAEKAGRNPRDVRIMAVTKGVEVARIEEALKAGHRLFGENYVQEAKEKWPALREKYPDAELHFIGPLQSNKALDAVKLFDAIHTYDRESLAPELIKAMKKEDFELPLLVEVNVGNEPQKHGVAPGELGAFIKISKDQGLKIRGLMAIPPVGKDPTPYFKALAGFAKMNGLKHLSMGMSGDFEAAISCGATIVRLGTALFGPRN
jgi:pyridoxal phosphate enzyme (YggS family)